MHSLKPAQISYNLFDSENWKRIGIFLVVELGIGVIVVLICTALIYIILYSGGYYGSVTDKQGYEIMGPLAGSLQSLTYAAIACFIVIVVGQMFALSVYERWRGCHLDK